MPRAPHTGSPVRWHSALTILAASIGTGVFGQLGVTTFGIQVKPVIPLEIFDPVTTVERPALFGQMELVGGFAFGMSVRVGLTNAVSLETGIGQIKRRYDYSLSNDTSGYAGSGSIRYVGYEIPVTGLVYIRLGERTWMNSALGFSLDMYPSDVQNNVEQADVYMFRQNWAQIGILGNMGVEYRTEKSGTLYLGATFHRPFNDMATVDMTYVDEQTLFPYRMRTVLDGSYLTADLRYYFHEDPDRTRVRRKN
ncbi:MAG: hypothetical protein R2815_00280 [Flavobacteriales bacterium]